MDRQLPRTKCEAEAEDASDPNTNPDKKTMHIERKQNRPSMDSQDNMEEDFTDVEPGASREREQHHQPQHSLSNSTINKQQSANTIYVTMTTGNILQYISTNDIDFETSFVAQDGPPETIQYLIRRRAIKITCKTYEQKLAAIERQTIGDLPVQLTKPYPKLSGQTRNIGKLPIKSLSKVCRLVPVTARSSEYKVQSTKSAGPNDNVQAANKQTQQTHTSTQRLSTGQEAASSSHIPTRPSVRTEQPSCAVEAGGSSQHDRLGHKSSRAMSATSDESASRPLSLKLGTTKESKESKMSSKGQEAATSTPAVGSGERSDLLRGAVEASSRANKDPLDPHTRHSADAVQTSLAVRPNSKETSSKLSELPSEGPYGAWSTPAVESGDRSGPSSCAVEAVDGSQDDRLDSRPRSVAAPPNTPLTDGPSPTQTHTSTALPTTEPNVVQYTNIKPGQKLQAH